jgi:TolA-binding protein
MAGPPMSASAPSPAEGLPAAPPAGERDLGAELDGLRRRLDDAAALIRRNQVALTELAESVGRLVAGQRRRERAFSLSSFGAYLIFTVLLGGGFLLLYQSRADDLVAARSRARHDREVAERRAEDLAGQLAARDAAAAAAHAFWRLLEDGQRDQAIATYPEVQAAALTPTERAVFADRERQARAAEVDAGYRVGLDAHRAGDHAAAIPALTRALGYEEEGPRAAQLRYYLGVSLLRTGAAEEAARQLELSIAGRVDGAGIVDARYWLAAALEALGRAREARAEYDRFATAQPTHPHSVTARRRSAALARVARPRN